jgi:hypothetical protein
VRIMSGQGRASPPQTGVKPVDGARSSLEVDDLDRSMQVLHGAGARFQGVVAGGKWSRQILVEDRRIT